VNHIEAIVGPFHEFFSWIPLCLDDFSQELSSHQICPAAPFLQWLLPLWTLGSTKVMAGFSFDAYTLIDRAQGVHNSESWWFTALGAVQVGCM